jgi:hypothetical protein
LHSDQLLQVFGPESRIGQLFFDPVAARSGHNTPSVQCSCTLTPILRGLKREEARRRHFDASPRALSAPSSFSEQ